MNFNLYLDDQTAKELDRTAKKLGETRSGLIRKALREWLDVKTPFREVPPRHQCAERLCARRTSRDGAAPSGGAAAIGRFGSHGDGSRVRAGAQSQPGAARAGSH